MRRHRGGHDEFEAEMEAEGEGELNLTPYLDVITTLVIYLVFTFQIVIEFRLIEMLPPELQGKGASAQQAEKQPTFYVFLRDAGYVLAAEDLPGGGQAAEVVKKKDGKFDPVKLHEVARKWKGELKLGTSVILAADPTVPYNEIVAAMDALRDEAGKALYPDIVFGQPVPAGSATPTSTPAPTGGQ